MAEIFTSLAKKVKKTTKKIERENERGRTKRNWRKNEKKNEILQGRVMVLWLTLAGILFYFYTWAFLHSINELVEQ